MVFSTIIFLFRFLPITLALYYLAPAKLKNTVLFLCSLVFYCWGEVRFFPGMVALILINYLSGLAIEHFDAKPALRRFFLLVALIGSLGMLFYFKYANFVLRSVNALLGTAFAEIQGIGTLPLGISFYTFQTLSYSIDVYRRDVKAERNIIDFGAYVVMFPQLIAGPIVKYRDVSDQLHVYKHRYNLKQIEEGMTLFTFGLAKKVLLADAVGALWTDIIGVADSPSTTFVGLANASTPLVWLGIIAYSLQLYFDFSGYSLMGIGMGKMLGFDFPANFNYPYISASITEFWRRWHISLGAWMRDYLFYPFALTKPMQRFGKWATSHWGKHFGRVLPAAVANLLVFAVVGIWHGPQAHYLAWGLYNGLVIALADLLEPAFKKLNTALHIPTESRGWHVFRIVRTFIIVNIGWYFDRNEFVQGCIYLRNTFTDFNFSALAANAPGAFAAVSGPAWGLVIISTLLVFAYSVLKEQGRDPYAEVQRLPLALRWGLYYLVIFMVLLSFICVNETVGFLYANF